MNFLVFVLTNWAFFAASIVVECGMESRSMYAGVLMVASALVLLWSPRSIAIFSGITLLIWLMALLGTSYRKSVSSVERVKQH